MVATLVVVLPSPHEGGALIVDHQGEKQRIQGAPCGKKLKLIAFYADCHHEIKPVRKGFRLALTYDLTLSSTKDSSAPVSAAFPVAQLTATLREHFTPSSKGGQAQEVGLSLGSPIHATEPRLEPPQKWRSTARQGFD
jgi:hypothetical protein